MVCQTFSYDIIEAMVHNYSLIYAYDYGPVELVENYYLLYDTQ